MRVLDRISTGVYRYPPELAAPLAIATIPRFPGIRCFSVAFRREIICVTKNCFPARFKSRNPRKLPA
jgi:O-acetyl-ADP-ribose deacetylase (regulator of RNase III)